MTMRCGARCSTPTPPESMPTSNARSRSPGSGAPRRLPTASPSFARTRRRLSPALAWSRMGDSSVPDLSATHLDHVGLSVRDLESLSAWYMDALDLVVEAAFEYQLGRREV